MLAEEPDLVIRALRDPSCMRGWTPRQFELLVRQASRSYLLHRIGSTIDAFGLGGCIPPRMASQLEGARHLLNSHRDEVTREIGFIRQALAPLQVQVVLLKGAAYLLAGLPAARGRLFSDIDILVPKSRLGEVEAALLVNGWAGTKQTAYDQHYYREWMHELPPLVHMQRDTALDVHHAIAPLTARWRTPSEPLLAAAIDVPGLEGFQTLAPADVVLHSMVHLLLNDDLSHGLRDVSDLDLLLRGFALEPAFWPRLVERARELGLQRALHHGLWCAQSVLHTPVPASVREAVTAWGPGRGTAAILHGAWRRALRSPHPSVSDRLTPLAMFLLYARAHWLRMPPLMLARHLTIKALKLHERHLPKQA